MTSSQYPHLYNEAAKIEEKRMAADLLYRVLLDPNIDKLNETVDYFVSQINKIYPRAASTRFKHMLHVASTDSNRLLKHSMILFALYQEPWALDYFMKDNASPPDKMSKFVSGDLKVFCDQLLNGSYTSLQAFVEDVRWNYVVL